MLAVHVHAPCCALTCTVLCSDSHAPDVSSCPWRLLAQIQSNFHELPAESLDSLRSAILAHLVAFSSNPGVAIHLAVALADLAVYMEGWPSPVSDVMEQLSGETGVTVTAAVWACRPLRSARCRDVVASALGGGLFPTSAPISFASPAMYLTRHNPPTHAHTTPTPTRSLCISLPGCQAHGEELVLPLLQFLRVYPEEIWKDRIRISERRCRALSQSLGDYIPQVFPFLENILEAAGDNVEWIKNVFRCLSYVSTRLPPPARSSPRWAPEVDP